MLRRGCFLIIAFCLCLAGYCQENYYVVRKGDYPGKIAKSFGIKLGDFLRWNNLNMKSNIDIGDTLWIVNPQTIENKSYESLKHNQELIGKTNENSEMTPDLGVERQKGNSTEVREESEVPKNNGVEAPKEDTKDNPKDKPKPKPIPEPIQTPSNSYSWVWLILSLLIGLVFGVFLFYVLYVKKVKAELEYKENELSRLNYNLTSEKSSAGSELSKLRLENRTLKQRNKDLDSENNSLREEIAQLITTQQREKEYRTERTIPVSTNMVSSETSRSSMFLYADAIIDDCFVKVRELPNEDSIFVLHLNGENSADFSIYKSAYQRVVANPSFLEGCEKQVLGDTMQLEIVSEGKAQRELSNGKWKVINKLNVIIR